MNAIRVFAAVLLLTAFASETSAIAIVNGSFEDTTGMTPGTNNNFFDGVPVGWTYTGNGIQLLSAAAGGGSSTAPMGMDGTLYLEIFNQDDLGTLSQTVDGLAIGNKYVVSFLWGNRGIAVAPVDLYDFTVEMGGATFTRSGSGVVDLTPASIMFVATATSHALNITFNDPGADTSTGGALDAFRIRGVPEPATLALVALGLTGLTAKRRGARVDPRGSHT